MYDFICWIRIQPMFALGSWALCMTACHKSQLSKGYKLSYTGSRLYHRLIVCIMHGLEGLLASLHAVRHMSLDSWELGCPGSSNILFQRQMSYIFKTKIPIPGRFITRLHIWAVLQTPHIYKKRIQTPYHWRGQTSPSRLSLTIEQSVKHCCWMID